MSLVAAAEYVATIIATGAHDDLTEQEIDTALQVPDHAGFSHDDALTAAMLLCQELLTTLANERGLSDREVLSGVLPAFHAHIKREG